MTLHGSPDAIGPDQAAVIFAEFAAAEEEVRGRDSISGIESLSSFFSEGPAAGGGFHRQECKVIMGRGAWGHSDACQLITGIDMDEHNTQQDHSGSDEWLKYHRPQKRASWRKISRQALKLDDAAIRDALESFLRGKYDENVKKRLRFLGDRLGPYLLEVLADSRLWTTHYELPREFGSDMTPFQTVVDLLSIFRHPKLRTS